MGKLSKKELELKNKYERTKKHGSDKEHLKSILELAEYRYKHGNG